MSIDHNYTVTIEPYASRHYIKLFSKKYKKAWEITNIAILKEAERIIALLETSDRAERIKSSGSYSLIKLYFRVAGTTDSAKSSGNRVILFTNSETRECRILLVYSKNEISQPNETQKWLNVIKENYTEIWKLFTPIP